VGRSSATRCFVVLESLALIVTFYVLLFQLCALLLLLLLLGFFFWESGVDMFIIIIHDITAYNRIVGFSGFFFFGGFLGKQMDRIRCTKKKVFFEF
jgi:hypothetical protein